MAFIFDSPFYKLPLIILSSICVQISFTSPNPLPAKQERARYEKIGAQDVAPPMGGKGPEIMKTLTHLINVADATTILMSHYSTHLPAFLAHAKPLQSVSSNPLTVIYILGVSLMTCASLCRLACYQKLGSYFTFHLSVQSKQKLVTTGPYAIVRHPSYAASLVYFVGAVTTQLLPGSWFYVVGGWESYVGIFSAGLWLWTIWITIAFFFRRTKQEDEVLHREFGIAWEEWARRTPYRLIPYVY